MADGKDNGGPAFPWGSGGDIRGGASLRDYFAAKAMQGFLSALGSVDAPGIDHAEGIAAEAYVVADAMLEARK